MGKRMFYHFVNINYGMHCKDPLLKDTPYGDFASDMLADKNFPWLHSLKPDGVFKYHDLLLNYLESKGACSQAIEVFEELFGMYLVSDYIDQWREHQNILAVRREKRREKLNNAPHS